MVSPRRAARAAGVALVIAASGAAIALAQDAPDPKIYPDDNGWTFTPVPSATNANQAGPASREGWESDGASCLVLNFEEEPTGILCSAENLYRPVDPTPPPAFTLPRDGNPPGSLWTEMTVLANVAGIFRSAGTWWSPRFTIEDDPALPNNVEIATAQLQYDRLMFIDQVLGESGTVARTEVTLFDEGSTPDVRDNPATANVNEETVSKQDDKRIVLVQEDLTSEDTSVWATQKADLGRTTLEPGRTYHMEFTSFLTTTESSQLIEGEVGLGYDNVLLSTTEPIPGPVGETGGAGATGGTGATGATGQQGPAGTGGDSSSGSSTTGTGGEVRGTTTVNSPEARRLLAISKLVPFRGIGKFRDQVRQRLICRATTLRRCEGTVKIRTANKVVLPGGRHRTRITLGQSSYVLPPGRVGYAKVFATPIGRRLILGRAPLRVDVTATVLDEDGVQQTLRERRTLTVGVR